MKTGMWAWWREGELRFGVRPRPEVRAPDDVLVHVVLTGLCRTDVAVAEGRLPCVEPCVLGHEVVGVVAAVGPGVRDLRVGDRVACGARVAHQRVGVERDGGFAEALVLPEHGLCRVPAALDWRRAALVEPVAACLAVRHAPLEGRVCLIGGGRIAELTRRILVALGIEPVASGECDVAIETGGTAASLETAMSAVRDGGLVVLKSRPSAPISFDACAAVERELRFQAVGWAPLADAFALLATLPVDDLLGPIHPLEAFGDLLGANESRKLFLAPDPTRCAESLPV